MGVVPLPPAYPVLLRKVIPVVQLLDMDEGWNQKAGVHLPLVRLSKP